MYKQFPESHLSKNFHAEFTWRLCFYILNGIASANLIQKTAVQIMKKCPFRDFGSRAWCSRYFKLWKDFQEEQLVGLACNPWTSQSSNLTFFTTFAIVLYVMLNRGPVKIIFKSFLPLLFFQVINNAISWAFCRISLLLHIGKMTCLMIFPQIYSECVRTL